MVYVMIRLLLFGLKNGESIIPHKLGDIWEFLVKKGALLPHILHYEKYDIKILYINDSTKIKME